MILNLTGLARASTPSPSPAPSTATPAPAMHLTPIARFQGPAMNPAAAAIASPPPPPPPPPPAHSVVLGSLIAANRSLAGQASGTVTPGTDAQVQASTMAREAVYAANGGRGPNVDPAVVAAAETAAGQAAMHVAAAQASGQDSVSLDVDHNTGQVGIAALEDKVAAVPMYVKAGVAVLAVLGIGKLLSRKK